MNLTKYPGVGCLLDRESVVLTLFKNEYIIYSMEYININIDIL